VGREPAVKNQVKTLTRVGRISFINSLPFYHHLFAGNASGFEFYSSYPTRINLAMRRSKIDIAPISSLEYLNHQKDYLLLPDLVIGSRDFSGSVLLLSKEKIEGLQDTTIALTRQSLSSAILLRVLLKFKYKLDNGFTLSSEDPHKTIAKYKAALVIGDDALLFQPKEFVYKYDLSELWWNWTEKPFCFAVWAVRKQFASKHPEEVAAFHRALKANLNRNLVDIETLIRETLHLSFLDAQFPKIFGYLFNLSYGFDANMQEGLELFYRLANRLGVSPRPKKLEFFELK
jgi:chorismate dehydratase